MIKTTILSLFLLCGCQTLPQGVNLEPPAAELFPIQDYNKYLEGKLKGQSANFVAAAARHGLDAKLLIGIAIWETGNGKSNAIKRYNNAMGAMRNGRLIRYKSVKASIDAMAANLSQNYVKQGRRSVGSIGKKYCPRGTKAWTKGVKSQIKKLK